MKRRYTTYATPELAESTEHEIFEGAKAFFNRFGIKSIYVYKEMYAIKIFGNLVFYRILKLNTEFRIEFAYICKQNTNIGIFLHLPKKQEV